MQKSTGSTCLSVAMKAQERRLLERAAGERPVSTWVREVAVTEAAKIIAREVIEEEGE